MPERYTLKDYLAETMDDLREGVLSVWVWFLALMAGLILLGELITR